MLCCTSISWGKKEWFYDCVATLFFWPEQEIGTLFSVCVICHFTTNHRWHGAFCQLGVTEPNIATWQLPFPEGLTV